MNSIAYTPVISLEALFEPSTQGDLTNEQMAERITASFGRIVTLEHQPTSKFLDIIDDLHRYEVRFFSLADAAMALEAHRALDKTTLRFLTHARVNYRRPSRIVFLGNGLEDWICTRGNKFLKMLLTHPDAAEAYANTPVDTDGFQLVTKKFAKRFNIFSVRIVRYYAFVECSTVHHACRLVEFWQNRKFYEESPARIVMNFANDSAVQVREEIVDVTTEGPMAPSSVVSHSPPTKPVPVFNYSNGFEAPKNVEAFTMVTPSIGYAPFVLPPPTPTHDRLQIMEQLLQNYNASPLARPIESRIVVRRFDCRETGGIMMPLPADLHEFFNFGHLHLLKNPNEHFVEARLATNNALITTTNVLRDNDVVLLLKPSDRRIFT